MPGDGGDLDVLAYESNRVLVRRGLLRHLPVRDARTLQARQSVLRDEVNPEIELISAEAG